MSLTSTDQLGNTVQIEFPPKRIVSLVPSQTEFLFDIGLNDEIVGVTRFCIHPAEKVKDKTKIGGTKKFNIERIKSLNPDLIIGNKEENYETGITELSKHFPVWISDIFTLNDALAMMLELGRIAGRQDAAHSLANTIESQFCTLADNFAKDRSKRNCAYFIWRKPYMVAASNTFIDHMLHAAGFSNVFSGEKRYPEINPETLQSLNPDFIFLSSEPYSFSEKHFEEFQAFAPNAKVILVDGEMFSWYGSRLKYAPAYFLELCKALY